MMFSIVNSVVNFWSFGVMHNYAMRRNSTWAKNVRKNGKIEEGRLSPDDEAILNKIGNTLRPEDAPDWLALVSIITTIVGIILFILYWFIK